MSMINHLIVLRLTEYLQQTMIDDISDVTKADEVKSYRFQDSPLDLPIYLSVLSGNPEEIEYIDARLGYKDMNDLGINIPSGEVGGGHLWWRRGRVRIGAYFMEGDVTEEEAADYAQIILGRAMLSIEECPVSDLVDEFGERAHWVAVVADNFSEGGGPENQYMWRGTIHWQVLTERPF